MQLFLHMKRSKFVPLVTVAVNLLLTKIDVIPN